jgi:transcriptional regulator with XRE-family HTH domain
MPKERMDKGDEPLRGPTAAAVGAAMLALREERGMSLADAAAGARVAPGRLAAVEDGRREPDFVLMMRLARVLGTSATEFIRRAEQPTPRDTED